MTIQVTEIDETQGLGFVAWWTIGTQGLHSYVWTPFTDTIPF